MDGRASATPHRCNDRFVCLLAWKIIYLPCSFLLQLRSKVCCHLHIVLASKVNFYFLFTAGKIASNPFAQPPPGTAPMGIPRPGMPGFNPMLPPPVNSAGMPGGFAPPNFAPPNFSMPHMRPQMK